MPFRWNGAASRYVRPNGRFASRGEVRATLDATLRNHGRDLSRMTVSLREGRLSLAAWQVAMRDEIKAVHLYAAAAARGGWDRLTPADYGHVGREVRRQYDFLNDFAQDIARGLSVDGRAASRAAMYAEAARTTYHRVDRMEQRDHNGMTEELSVLHAAEHCYECVDEADRGWVPIGTCIDVGSRVCGPRCKCTMSYR